MKVTQVTRSLRHSLVPLSPAIALVAVQLIFFGLPAGAWVRAVVIGLLTALLAVGMALVYRANRVLNFSQADLGFVPATLSVGLIVFNGLPFLFGFGVAFLLPVLLMLLERVGILTLAQLKAGRRYAVVGIAVVSAVLTPPDIMSQILLLVPMYLLYEMAILAIMITGRRRAKQEEAAAAE